MIIEAHFDADVRGNRITLHGAPSEIAMIERVLEELVQIIRTGPPRTR